MFGSNRAEVIGRLGADVTSIASECYSSYRQYGHK